MPKRGKKIAKRQVQSTEDAKFIPKVEAKPEIDCDPVEDDGLTLRQREFVKAITGPARGNATRAAEMAGYASENRNALKATASELLAKPCVQEAISHALAAKRATPEWAKSSLIDLAASSMQNFVTVDANGEARIDFAKAAAAGALGQIKEYREEVLKIGDSPVGTIKRTIKIHDRTAALGLLLKFHGLVTDFGNAGSAKELLTPDPALAQAALPPGSVPGVESPGTVQDDSRGAAERKDGDIREA